jgi:hypothetical protein
MRDTLDRLTAFRKSALGLSERLLALIVFTWTLVPAGIAQSFSRNVGIYHWNGQFSNTMSQGVEQITLLGGRTARVALTPRYYTDYNIGGPCYPNYTLSTIAQEADVKKAFDNPKIDVFMLTAYDGTTFGDCVNQRYLNPGFYTPSNVAAIAGEYSDFTLYLYETFRSTHKRFIISNWESDNDVYCGSAYSYATNASARATCDASYPTLYGGNKSPSESLDGLKLWLQVRHDGIEDGKRRAMLAGIGGDKVYLAPEFCAVHMLHDAGFKSVLYDVLPFVIFDYVSYSSYESINRVSPDAALVADLGLIENVIGSNAIIIGEAGFSRYTWGNDGVIKRTALVVNAALTWGVPYFFQWNLYDQSTQQDFGIYDIAGMPTPLAEYYRQGFVTANNQDTVTVTD